MGSPDLFGDIPQPPIRGGYYGIPGAGPKGETCGSCKFSQRWRQTRAPRWYWKCGHPANKPVTKGAGTDIRKGSPACQHWEADNE